MLRIDAVEVVELALAAVRGDDGVGAGDDEGGHAVAHEVGRQRVRQRRHVAPVAQRGPGLAGEQAAFDVGQRRLARAGALAPFGRVAAVQLVGQQQQAALVGLHGVVCHAVAFALQQFGGLKVVPAHHAARGGGAAGAAAQRQGQGRGQQKGRRADGLRGGQASGGAAGPMAPTLRRRRAARPCCCPRWRRACRSCDPCRCQS